jgi:hypothetical protein
MIFRNKEAKQKALGSILAKELDRLSRLKITINQTDFAPKQ